MVAETSLGALSRRTAFVTGGTGFIGARVVSRLIDLGAQVGVLVRDSSSLGRLRHLRNEITLVEGDLCTAGVFTSDVSLNPDIIIHLAAAGVENPLGSVHGLIQANVAGTAHLLAASLSRWEKHLQTFVYVGTDFEYGHGVGMASRIESQDVRPTNYYAATKASGWQIVQAMSRVVGFNAVGVRPFYTYGPDQGKRRVIPYVVLAALCNADIELTACTQTRDFIFVDDVVEGLLHASLHVCAEPEMFNIGTGRASVLRDVIEQIVEITQTTTRPRFGARDQRPGEIAHLVADTSKTRRVLAWNASTELQTGLERTIEWYREQNS